MKKKTIVNRESVSAILPDVPPDFEREMQSMIYRLSRERKETQVKKKLSVGLVFALALALVVIGALAAALLGGKDFVDQILAPKATKTQSDQFTRAELDEILSELDKNGVTLPDELRKRLDTAQGEYKDELMRAVAKVELGFYPSTWSLEDQLWYDRLMVETGMTDRVRCCVPEGDEISLDQAAEIAREAILQFYGADIRLEDTALYRRHVTYYSYFDSAYHQGRQWNFWYQPLTVGGAEYAATLESDGTVLDLSSFGGFDDPKDALPMTVRDAYVDIYGTMDDWSPELWVEFSQALAASAETHVVESKSLAAILKQTYVLPQDTDITREQAIEKALSQIQDREGLIDTAQSAVCLTEGDARVWRAAFLRVTENEDGTNNGEYLCFTLDAKTGEALRASAFDRDATSWSARYVLDKDVELFTAINAPAQSDASAPAPTRRPDGRPYWWGSDVAPDYYWKAMEEFNYNADTADQLMNGWYAEYGEDKLFWPIDASALDYIFHEYMEGDVLRGLPDEDDMTQEDAEKLALNTFNASYTGDAEKTAMSVSFWFNTQGDGSHTWQIDFIRLNEGYGAVEYTVLIDAKTGLLIEEAAEETEKAPRTTIPANWRNENAPEEFWDALETLGCTVETAPDIFKKCHAEYGDDPILWPLEMQALDYVWNQLSDEEHAVMILGLPGKDEISREKAIEIARAAFLEKAKGILPEGLTDKLKPGTAFWYNDPDIGKNKWIVQFLDDSYVIYGYVEIDPKTGDVIFAEASIGGNG